MATNFISIRVLQHDKSDQIRIGAERGIFQDQKVISMKSKRISFKTDIDLDFGFWAILPAININRHSKSLEFEWLCIGIYISRIQSHE